MSAGKLANFLSTTAGPPSRTPAAFTGSEVEAAAATRSAAAFRAVASSSPPMPQAFGRRRRRRREFLRERGDCGRERRTVGRRRESATGDESIGRQRLSAGKRVMPRRGMVQQIEQRCILRQIEVDRHRTGLACRDQQPCDACSPRVRIRAPPGPSLASLRSTASHCRRTDRAPRCRAPITGARRAPAQRSGGRRHPTSAREGRSDRRVGVRQRHRQQARDEPVAYRSHSPPAARPPDRRPRSGAARCRVHHVGWTVDSNTSGGAVGPSDHVAGGARPLQIRAGQLIHRLRQTRSANASSAATTSVITPCSAFFSAAPKCRGDRRQLGRAPRRRRRPAT